MQIEKLKIEDVCIVGDGSHASIERTEDGIMYLSSKNFNKNGIVLDSIEYISEENYKKHFRDNSNALTKPKENDLIFSIIGSIGGVYIYKKDDKFGLSSSVAILRPDVNLINGSFLSYYLKSNFLQQWIEIIKSGSAQGFVSLGMIKKLPLIIPVNIKIQSKIANILSNYDNLIENNTKRIKLLEEMAEKLYKEWFVRLRFPNYENTKIVDGLPEGWENKKLGDVFDTSSGGTPSRKHEEYFNGNIPWIKTGELKNIFVLDTEEHISSEALKNSSTKLFKENTIVIAMYCAMPYLSILTRPSSTNQACCAFLPKRDYLDYSFIYFFIKNVQQGLILHAHGAAQQNLSQEIISNYKNILPSEELVMKYSTIANPIFQNIKLLMLKNQNLKETRDLLLPRLLSGKLNIEDLEIV